jgi:hypothetical protein
MVIQTPTRITIEVLTPIGDGIGEGQPTVRVIPEGPASSLSAVAGAPREEVPGPVEFDPGPCHCLDDEDCNADHANE